MQIMGKDATRGSEYSRNIVVRHNLFDDVSTSWGGPAGFLVTGDGAQDVTIDHNTIIHTGFVVASAGDAEPGLRLHQQHDEAQSVGHLRQRSWRRLRFDQHLLHDRLRHAPQRDGRRSRRRSIRPTTSFPATADFLTQFVNPSTGDYRLAPASPFKGRRPTTPMLGSTSSKLAAVQAGQ